MNVKEQIIENEFIKNLIAEGRSNEEIIKGVIGADFQEEDLDK